MKFRGTEFASKSNGAAISPREPQRFVPKQGRATETVGPPNVRLLTVARPISLLRTAYPFKMDAEI